MKAAVEVLYLGNKIAGFHSWQTHEFPNSTGRFLMYFCWGESIPLYSSPTVSYCVFPLPGQVQDVSLCQEEPGAPAEVTADLNLEVVPESSGDWQNVFP